jgi:hypothetical protein
MGRIVERVVRVMTTWAPLPGLSADVAASASRVVVCLELEFGIDISSVSMAYPGLLLLWY